MRFEFATATRIIFGAGTLPEAGLIAASVGQHALVVHGLPEERITPLTDALKRNGVAYHLLPVEGEPTVASIQNGVRYAMQQRCDLIIGIGGGSALDSGKAIAVLLTNPGDLLNYLEVIGKGQPLAHPPVPYIAIPTTAGTGAEVTRNAVISSPEYRVKVSLRSPLMLPMLALVDPELTYSLPLQVTATTGLDALTQLIEPYVCNSPNPIVDAICREGILRVARSLRRAYLEGSNIQAREDMCLASLFGGLALANARLGAVHGFAAPIGGMFSAPHGAICARLLPFVMASNISAMHERTPNNPALRRYDEIARYITNDSNASAMDGVRWIQELCTNLKIPPLSTHGLTIADFPDLIARSIQSSSMKGNPIQLTVNELQAILNQSL
jgi:alcohol dehydrogenase class IV